MSAFFRRLFAARPAVLPVWSPEAPHTTSSRGPSQPLSAPVEDSVCVRVETTQESSTDDVFVSIDIDDQNTSAPAIQPPATHPEWTAPPAAAYYSSIQTQEDVMADFFGFQHGNPRASLARNSSSLPLPAPATAPPAYSVISLGETLPSYSESPAMETHTLARFMFIYGFFMPLFWLMGVFILFNPVQSTAEWEASMIADGKGDVERQRALKELREIEAKWAWNCAVALAIFSIGAGGVVITVLFATGTV